MSDDIEAYQQYDCVNADEQEVEREGIGEG
jgi:hypothetical protein